MTQNEKRAVVLLSGGLDSTTLLAMAHADGFSIYAMSFRYGQRHDSEIKAAQRIAEAANVAEHVVVDIDLRVFGGSALTDDIAVPKEQSVEAIDDAIPVTYVPARNTIFLSFALAWAEVLKSNAVFIGVNAVDYSGYPDCRPEFIAAYQSMARLATTVAVQGQQSLTIHTPLIDLTKADIIRKGIALGVDYSQTTSCYDADEAGRACGSCHACLLRRKGFDDAQIDDPTRYVSEAGS